MNNRVLINIICWFLRICFNSQCLWKRKEMQLIWRSAVQNVLMCPAEQ